MGKLGKGCAARVVSGEFGALRIVVSDWREEERIAEWEGMEDLGSLMLVRGFGEVTEGENWVGA